MIILNNSSIVHSMLYKSQDRKSLNSPLGCIQLTYIKSIDMPSKNTTGVQKSEAKSEAPISSYSHSTKNCDIW